jgi:serine protease
VSLSWQHDGTDELSFDLQRRSPAGTGDWVYLDSVAGGSTGYVDSTVAEENSYDYQINAENAAGMSSWSIKATTATPAAASVSLSANGYKVKGKQKVDLSWSGAGTTVYIIRDGITIAQLVPQSSFTDNIDLKGSATYVYSVCNTDSPDCSDEVVVVF